MAVCGRASFCLGLWAVCCKLRELHVTGDVPWSAVYCVFFETASETSLVWQPRFQCTLLAFEWKLLSAGPGENLQLGMAPQPSTPA